MPQEYDAPQGVTLQKPQPVPPPTGVDALAFGPTSRPDEPVTKDTQRNAVPDYIFQALPALVKAASMPDAPPALRALIRLMDTNINTPTM